MRIGLFTDTYVPEINGIVTVLQMMSSELKRRGHEVYVFCPSYPEVEESAQGTLRFSSVKFIFYRGMRLAIPYKRGALRVIPRLNLIHSHTLGPMGLLALLASKRYRIPHVHTYHDLYTDYRRYLPRAIRPTRGMVKWLSREFSNRCDAIIAPSNQMKQELEGYRIESPIHALSFGVDADEFSCEPGWNVREALNLPSEDLLLYAGRLGAEKNIEFLLRAFKRIIVLRPSARLIIAGDGPHRGFLKEYAASLGVAPYVVFTGFLKRADLIDLYKQAILFVFASKTETQGLVVVEAMMAGTAVVAIGIMGPKDIITPGETGILVGEDEEEFSQACYKLLLDEKERHTLGTAARQWARSHSSQLSTEKLLGIYSHYIGETKRIRGFSMSAKT